MCVFEFGFFFISFSFVKCKKAANCVFFYDTAELVIITFNALYFIFVIVCVNWTIVSVEYTLQCVQVLGIVLFSMQFMNDDISDKVYRLLLALAHVWVHFFGYITSHKSVEMRTWLYRINIVFIYIYISVSVSHWLYVRIGIVDFNLIPIGLCVSAFLYTLPVGFTDVTDFVIIFLTSDFFFPFWRNVVCA